VNQEGVGARATADESQSDSSEDTDSKRDASRSEQASELAWGLAKLIPNLPVQAATDLKRLLARTLTLPSPAELRQARLGLLIDLVMECAGEVPSVDDYNRARAARTKNGEVWPSHTSLIRAYGSHWLAAVRAAMKVAFADNQARISSDNHHRAFKERYTREECLDAVRRCAAMLGARPTLMEYSDWVILARRSARAAGQAEPRLPSREVVLQRWGSWTDLRDAACA
jgi:hypothetical protein